MTAKVKSIPKKLAKYCHDAFRADVLAKYFEVKARNAKGKIKDYLNENKDGFKLDLDVSKSFHCDEGEVTLATRKNFEYDNDAILALIKDGTLSVESLIKCISSYKAESLQLMLGDRFANVTTVSHTEFLQTKSGEAFKDEIIATVNSEMPKIIPFIDWGVI